MIEAFERHLADIDISKKFEKAKNKEEKIEACIKYLEDNEYAVYKKGKEKFSGVASGSGGGGFNNLGTIAMDANTFGNLVLTGGGGGIGNLGTITSSQPITPPKIEYLQSIVSITDDDMLFKFNDKQHMHSYVLDYIVSQFSQSLRNLIIDNNLIKEDFDYATGSKKFGVKIGIVK